MKTFYTAIGGRMAKWKGKVVSFAPSVSASVSMGTTAALMMGAPAAAQEVQYSMGSAPIISSAEQSVQTLQRGTGDIEAFINYGDVSSTVVGGTSSLTTTTTDNAITATVVGNRATSSLDIATLTGTADGSNGVIASALENTGNDAWARVRESGVTATVTDLSDGSSANLSGNSVGTAVTLSQATNILSGLLSGTFANTDAGLVAVVASTFAGTTANASGSLLLQSSQLNNDVQTATPNSGGSSPFSSFGNDSDIQLTVNLNTDTALSNSVLTLEDNSLSAAFTGALATNTLSVESGGMAELSATAGISNVQVADNVGTEIVVEFDENNEIVGQSAVELKNASTGGTSGITANINGDLTSTSIELTNNDTATTANQNTARNTLYVEDGLSVTGQASNVDASNIDLVSGAASTSANIAAADLFISNVQSSVDSSIYAQTEGDTGINLTAVDSVSGVSVDVTSNALTAAVVGNSTTGNLVVAGANSLDGIVVQSNVQSFSDQTPDALANMARATVSDPSLSATVGSSAGSTIDAASISLNDNTVSASATANNATMATDLSGNALTDGVGTATGFGPRSATDVVAGSVGVTGGFSSVNAQSVTGEADESAPRYVVQSIITDDTDDTMSLTVGNTTAALTDSVIEMQGNLITSAARANVAQQSLGVTANDLTASAAVVGMQTLTGGVQSRLYGASVALNAYADGVDETDVANVTLSVEGNASSSLAVGSTASNSMAVSATSLTAIGASVTAAPDGDRTALNLDGLPVYEDNELVDGATLAFAQLSLLNTQYSKEALSGDAIFSDVTNSGFSVKLSPSQTTEGSTVTNAVVSLDGNSLASTARANMASNSMVLDIGSMALGSAVVNINNDPDADPAAGPLAGGTNIAVLGSTQMNSIAVTATVEGDNADGAAGLGLSDFLAEIARDDGAISSSRLSTDSNSITALASANSVNNTFALKGTVIATVDGQDLSPQVRLETFPTAKAGGLEVKNTAFAVGNMQSNAAAVTAGINYGNEDGDLYLYSEAYGGRTIADSTISADANRIVAQAVAASDSTTASSIDATSITTSLLAASKQTNTGSVWAGVGGYDSSVSVGVATSWDGTLDNSTASVSSNTIASTATALSDVTRITLGGSQTATLDGAGGIDNGDAEAFTSDNSFSVGVNADYGLAQLQQNDQDASVTAETDYVELYVTVGTLQNSSLAADSNLLTAMATAVSGTTAVTGTAASIGGTTAPVFATTSFQSNYAAVSSALSYSNVNLSVQDTGTTADSETVTLDGNALTAQATGVAGNNTLTTTSDAQTGGRTDMANAEASNSGSGTLAAEADRMLLSDQRSAGSVSATIADAEYPTFLQIDVFGATKGTSMSMASNTIAGTATGATSANTITNTAGGSNAASTALLAAQQGTGGVTAAVTLPSLDVTLRGEAEASSVAIASNAMTATATGMTGSNRVAILGGSIDPVAEADSSAMTVVQADSSSANVDDTFASLSSFQSKEEAVRATISDDGADNAALAAPVSPSVKLTAQGATTNSTLEIASNTIAATATAGTVTNVLSQAADTSINYGSTFGGSSLVAMQKGTDTADVTATIKGVTIALTGTSVAGSTLDVRGNVANATATGFSAFNTSSLVAGTSLTGDGDGGGVGADADVLTVTETASLLANSQTNAGDVTAEFNTSNDWATTPSMKVVLSGAVTGDSAIDVSGNTMRAQATGVLAQNISTLSAGLMTDIGAALSNDQDASGAITANLGASQFAITGTSVDGTLATSNNIAVASATAASATNRLALSSDTSIDGARSLDQDGNFIQTTNSIDLDGNFSTTDALALLNRQASSGDVSSSINGALDPGEDGLARDVAIGTTLTGSLTGSISTDSNILVAQSRGNIADSALTLTAGSSISDGTQAVLASSQDRSGSIQAVIDAEGTAQIGIATGTGGVAGSLSVSDNIVRATGSANVAINAMSVTGAAGIDAMATGGAQTAGTSGGTMTTTAQYAVMNGQDNASAVLSKVASMTVGIDADQGGTNTGSMALNGNMVMADATGNSAANSLKLYADGTGTDGSAALSNYQVNTGAMSALVEDTNFVVASGAVNGSVVVSNNAITASATGNVSSSTISTAGSVFTSF